MNKQLRKALVELSGSVQTLANDVEVSSAAREAASTASFLFNRDVDGAVTDVIAEEAIAQFVNAPEFLKLQDPMSQGTKDLIERLCK